MLTETLSKLRLPRFFNTSCYSGWSPELNLVMIDVDDLLKLWESHGAKAVYLAFLIAVHHERLHSLIKWFGASANVAYMNLANVNEVFSSNCIDKNLASILIKRELLADLIFLSSKPVVEGFAAYYHHKHSDPNPSKKSERNLSEEYSFIHGKLKESLLTDNMVKEIFTKFIHLDQMLNSYQLPFVSYVLALDIPFPVDLNYIPSFDDIDMSDDTIFPEQRFWLIVSLLEDLDRKKPLVEWNFVEKFLRDLQSGCEKISSSALGDFLTELAELANLPCSTESLFDAVWSNHPQLTALLFDLQLWAVNGELLDLSCIDVTLDSFFKNKLDPKLAPWLRLHEHLIVGHISWIEIKDGHVKLIKNPLTPPELFKFWVKHFVRTYLKDCIIEGREPRVPDVELGVGHALLKEQDVVNDIERAKDVASRIDFSNVPENLIRNFKITSRLLKRELNW